MADASFPPAGAGERASELHLLSKFHEPLASLQLLQTKTALALKKEEKNQLLLQDGCVVSFCGATDCVCGSKFGNSSHKNLANLQMHSNPSIA